VLSQWLSPSLSVSLQFSSLPSQKSTSLPFTKLLLLQNSVTPKRSPVLFSTWLLHQDSSSFSLFRRINATPLLFIIRAAFIPVHLHTQNVPCTAMQPSWKKHPPPKSGWLIIPKHTLKARAFTLCGNPLLCYTTCLDKPTLEFC